MPAAFEFGPTNGNFVGVILGRSLELKVRGRFTQETRDEQSSLATDAPSQIALLHIEKTRSIMRAVFPSCHSCSVLVDQVAVRE